MEAHNHFTCIAYDTVDFLIQSKYVIFGIYLAVEKDVRSIIFNRETLPHIHIGTLLEEEFSCKPIEDCNVVLVMKKQNFEADVQKLIVDYTETAFPASGNLAVSVRCSVVSKIIDIKTLRLIPAGIRPRQTECGVCAIGFQQEDKNQKLLRKQILISPDNLLRKLFSAGLIRKK